MRKIIISGFALIFLCVSISKAETPKLSVASVNVMEIEEMLLSSLAKNDKYSQLIKRFKEQINAENEKDRAFDKAIANGKVDFSQMISERTQWQSERDGNLHKQVDNMLQSELILIIEQLFPDKYDLVLEESRFANNIIYNKLVIHDITTNIKQHLLTQIGKPTVMSKE